MRKLFCLAAFLSFLFCADVDAKSTQTPFRIVSLNPAVTEILFELGEGANVVGTTEYSDFPESAKNIPRVGSYLQPSIEKIISLKPDIVFVAKEGVDNISEQLKRSRLNFSLLSLNTLEDFPQAIDNIAKQLYPNSKRMPSQYQKLKSDWQQGWSEFKYKKTDRTVLIEVDRTPQIVAGQNTFLNSLIEKCGFKNAIAKTTGYFQYSQEALSQLKYDIKLSVLHSGGTQNATSAPTLSFNPNDIARVTPRLVQNTKRLCEKLNQKIDEELLKQ